MGCASSAATHTCSEPTSTGTGTLKPPPQGLRVPGLHVKEFVVQIGVETYQGLGLELKRNEENGALVVVKVRTGAPISSWRGPSEIGAVTKNDCIVAVNGTSGDCMEMLARLATEQELVITFIRLQNAPSSWFGFSRGVTGTSYLSSGSAGSKTSFESRSSLSRSSRSSSFSVSNTTPIVGLEMVLEEDTCPGDTESQETDMSSSKMSL
mmetsp:Transcript_45555/g.105629  ORF Transcript_45555/g.105629 Transcript_45555/m.105629 type:complete len:209 (-) Transcript_45555:32-658(-)